MAAKDLDFQNYIYLFNDPNQVVVSYNTKGTTINDPKFIKERAGLYFSAYNSSYIYKSVSEYLQNGISGDELGYNVFSNFDEASQNVVYGDFPVFIQNQSIVTALRKEYRPNEGIYENGRLISTNLNTPGEEFQPYFRSTNDIGMNPFNRHSFVVDGDSITYKYENISNTGQNPLRQYYTPYYSPISEIGFGEYGIGYAQKAALNTVLNNPITQVPMDVRFFNERDFPGQIYTSYVQAASADDYLLHPYQNNYGNPYTYTQNFWLTAVTSFDDVADANIVIPNAGNQEGEDNANYQNHKGIFGVHYPDYVNQFIEKAIQGPPSDDGSDTGINSPKRLILDSATKIGVPYDTHTVIEEKIDLQSYGVKNATPSFEGVYNYYDFEYEGVAISLINNERLNENALPSVYDFLYLSEQYNTISSFLDVDNLINFKNQNFSLGEIERYLSSFSKVHQEYLNGSMLNNSDDLENSQYTESDLVKNLADFDYSGLPQLPAAGPAAYLFYSYKAKLLKKMALEPVFAKNVRLSKITHAPKWLEEVKTGIYFSEKTMNIFNQANSQAERFPFVMKINIPTEAKGPIANILSQVDLLDAINTHAASLTTPLAINEVNQEFDLLNTLTQFGYDPNIGTVGNFYGALINGADSKFFNLFEEVRLKTFRMHFTNSKHKSLAVGNFDDPFYYSSDQLSADALDPFISPADLFLDTFQDIGLESPKNVFTYSEKEDEMGTNLVNLLKMLQGKNFAKLFVEKIIEGGVLRTPADIQAGKLAHQETLMYEIAKYDANDAYIQSVFVPISELDNISYIDTQVIPYKNYHYKIFAHKVIVGTKYRMEKFSFSEKYKGYLEPVIELGGVVQNLYKHRYLVQPYLQFVRVPYYNAELVNTVTDSLNFSRIEDYPPLPPQVQFAPYQGINNKFLLLFNNSVGEVVQRPTPIFDSEIEIFANIAISQKSKGLQGGITFKGDDALQAVQIFRIENKPFSYMDFIEDPTFAFNSTNSDFEEEGFSSSAYVSNVHPNKDYYYFFRSIDVHGKVSNPTSVYKVRIVSDPSSAPYLKVELFNFEKPKKLMDSKKFKKYLLLEANGSHNVAEYPNLITDIEGKALGNYETETVNIGKTSGNSIFGKKYKLRITSKQTGRKIDVNVTFKEPRNIINDK